MRRRYSPVIVAVWALCALAQVLPGAQAARTPNIIVTYVDNLGNGDIGAPAAGRQRTPNLDRMAAEGMKFTSFYAPVGIFRAHFCNFTTACGLWSHWPVFI